MAAPPDSPQAPQDTRTAGGSLRDDVQRILDMIRPMIQADEGDVELVDVGPDGVVSVRFHGACVGCPSSSMTLQAGIERSLKQHVPQVRAVRSVA